MRQDRSKNYFGILRRKRADDTNNCIDCSKVLLMDELSAGGLCLACVRRMNDFERDNPKLSGG